MSNKWFKEAEKDIDELQITQEAVSYTHLDVYKRQVVHGHVMETKSKN